MMKLLHVMTNVPNVNKVCATRNDVITERNAHNDKCTECVDVCTASNDEITAHNVECT